MRRSWLCVVCLGALALGTVLAGCGSSEPRDAAPSARAVRTAFHDSPAALAAVHAQADQLLPGGPRALRARLRALRGHPVVVNLWGSWCEPCQSEFPVFQRAAVRFGRTVAFLGIDTRDSDSAARGFLKRFPVTYPSYVDPDQAIVRSLQTLGVTPQTFFFDRSGRQVDDHGGSYRSLDALARDIRYYLHP